MPNVFTLCLLSLCLAGLTGCDRHPRPSPVTREEPTASAAVSAALTNGGPEAISILTNVAVEGQQGSSSGGKSSVVLSSTPDDPVEYDFTVANAECDGAVAMWKEGNYEAAAKVFEKWAKQGHPEGAYNLGVLYDEGTGVPQDPAEALRLYRLAAESGLDVAEYNLGVAYYRGLGVDQNYPEAAKRFLVAAEQGYASAQFNLGVMHYKGHGVERDITAAYAWLALAGEQDDEGADAARRVLATMTPEQQGEGTGNSQLSPLTTYCL